MSENEALAGVGSRMESGSDGKAVAKLRSPMSGERSGKEEKPSR